MTFQEKESSYSAKDFPPFAVTVDISVLTLVNNSLRMLLIQRGIDPFKGEWALPGGFVQENETIDAAAERELFEETGIHAPLEQLKTYGDPQRDPRMRVVTVAYWSILPNLPQPKSGTDASNAELVPVAEIESGRISLAFDHEIIVKDSIEKVRSSLETRTLATRFCENEFTIKDLRNVYEKIWGTPLDPGNFQRKAQQNNGFIKSTGKKTPVNEKGGRPAELWKAGDADALIYKIPRS